MAHTLQGKNHASYVGTDLELLAISMPSLSSVAYDYKSQYYLCNIIWIVGFALWSRREGVSNYFGD